MKKIKLLGICWLFAVQILAGNRPVLKPGFPVKLARDNIWWGPLDTGPVIVDIDKDGYKEILQCARDSIFVIRHDGTLQNNWPKKMAFAAQQNVSVGDVNGDGELEIIARDRDPGSTGKSYIYAWTPVGEMLPGFPISAPMTTNQPKTPTLFDFDKDGCLEIAYTSNYTLNIINSAGNSLPGWPITKSGRDRLANLMLGRFTESDSIQIVVTNHDSLYIFNVDGSLFTKPIPVPIANHYINCFSIADQNGDGISEVFFSLDFSVFPPVGYKIGLYSILTGFLPGWPLLIPADDNSIEPHTRADLNNDGFPEIIWTDKAGNLRAYGTDGISLPGLPVLPEKSTSSVIDPVVGDIDGDGDFEIFCDNNKAFDDSSHYHVYHHDGSEVWWSPLVIPWAAMFNSPAINDLDGDGNLEIAFISTNPYPNVHDVYLNVYMIEGVPYKSERFPWPMHAHDPQHTYWYDFKYQETSIRKKYPQVVSDKISQINNYPNPFNVSTRICYMLPEPMEVTLKIFNLRGEQVANVKENKQNAGEHSFIWNGDKQSSGLYICLIEGRNITYVRKMVLLR